MQAVSLQQQNKVWFKQYSIRTKLHLKWMEWLAIHIQAFLLSACFYYIQYEPLACYRSAKCIGVVRERKAVREDEERVRKRLIRGVPRFLRPCTKSGTRTVAVNVIHRQSPRFRLHCCLYPPHRLAPSTRPVGIAGIASKEKIRETVPETSLKRAARKECIHSRQRMSIVTGHSIVDHAS